MPRFLRAAHGGAPPPWWQCKKEEVAVVTSIFPAGETAIRSAKLHVADSGVGGEVVVFLHGLAGSCRFWDRLVARCGPQRRYLAPDLLGFGRSPWPDVDYSVATHVEALERDVLSRLEVPFHLVGHSTGAVLAVELAARHPARIRSLSLMALPYFDSEHQARRLLSADGGWPWLMLHMPRLSGFLCACICQRRRFWRHLMPLLVRRFPREVVLDGMLHSYQSVSSTLLQCIVRHRVDDAMAKLVASGIPLAHAFDDDDEVIPASSAAAFHEKYSTVTLRRIRGGGHGFPLLAPAETAEFLDAVAR